MSEKIQIDGLYLTSYTLLQVINEQVAIARESERTILTPELSKQEYGVRVSVYPMRPSTSRHEYTIERQVEINGRTLWLTGINLEGCFVEIGDACVIHSIPMTAMQAMSILVQRAEEQTLAAKSEVQRAEEQTLAAKSEVLLHELGREYDATS